MQPAFDSTDRALCTQVCESCARHRPRVLAAAAASGATLGSTPA